MGPGQTERESPGRRWEPEPLHAPEPHPPGQWRDRQSDEQQDDRPAGSHVVVIDLD